MLSGLVGRACGGKLALGIQILFVSETNKVMLASQSEDDTIRFKARHYCNNKKGWLVEFIKDKTAGRREEKIQLSFCYIHGKSDVSGKNREYNQCLRNMLDSARNSRSGNMVFVNVSLFIHNSESTGLKQYAW